MIETIALCALALCAVIAAIVGYLWLAMPEPEVPYIDSDGFPRHD